LEAGPQGLQNATGFDVECKLKFRDMLTYIKGFYMNERTIKEKLS